MHRDDEGDKVVKSPEFQPENSSATEAMVKEAVMEDNNGADFEEEVSKNREGVMEDINGADCEEEFSENSKDFLNGEMKKSTPVLNGDSSKESVFLNNEKKIKRKKIYRIKELGQASGGHYSSSNERPIKGPKTCYNDSDPFGFDPFILGNDEHVVKTRGWADPS
ncbi:hypothetical protein Hanom_Chr14g01298771 [Helianthus anomalus]